MLDDYNLNSYCHVIFDLDDTLIHERDYLFAGYKVIANKLGKNSIEANRMFLFLRDNFELGFRTGLFDSMIQYFGLSFNELPFMIGLLRDLDLKTGLSITNEGKAILKILKTQKKKYTIITNGNPKQQANKIRQIVWGSLPKPSKVIFANEFKPKPSIESFRHLQINFCQKKILMIGDSDIDRDFASKAKIDFYRINLIHKSVKLF